MIVWLITVKYRLLLALGESIKRDGDERIPEGLIRVQRDFLRESLPLRDANLS